jgi:hypothetical protein
MKVSSAIAIVLASVGFADAGDFCALQPKSCINLPKASAKACSSLICMTVQENIRRQMLTLLQLKLV